MTWIKVDDHFDEHPKLAAVGPVGWGVWLAGLAYCNRNLTDGFIPYSIAEGIGGGWLVRTPADDPDDRTALREQLEQVWHISRTSGMSGEDMDAQWVADLLVYYGLWEPVRGGYRVHDYSDYQPTKAVVLAERAKKAAAGRAGGLATAVARVTAHAAPPAKAQSKPVPVPTPVPKPVSPGPGRNGLAPLRETTSPKPLSEIVPDLAARFGSRKEGSA